MVKKKMVTCTSVRSGWSLVDSPKIRLCEAYSGEGVRCGKAFTDGSKDVASEQHQLLPSLLPSPPAIYLIPAPVHLLPSPSL